MDSAKTLSPAKVICETAIMAAVICVLGPLSIPIGIIPVSLGLFAVYLAADILGMKTGTASVLVYLLIGLVGVPVFTGFQGGPQKLFGPTGGFLFSYLFVALIAGYAADHFSSILTRFLCCLLALAACYTIGMVYLSFQAGMTMGAAFKAAVLPFIALDAAKIIAAFLIAKPVRSALMQAGMLPPAG